MFYRPSSTAAWSFLGIVLLQTIVILGFEAYIFGRFQTDLHGDYSDQTQSRTIPTFLTLYSFGFFYQLVLVWDALRLKNTIQIVGLVLYNAGLLLYGAIQSDQIKDAVYFLAAKGEIDVSLWGEAKPFLIAIPCILGFTTIVMGFISWKLYNEFAWTIYKHISADLRMKRRYLTYQVYIALLKFDFFFFLGFTVQFVVIVRNHNTIEWALTIAAIPVTIIILLLAAHWTQRENRVGMAIIIVIYFAALAYFIFKLFRMYQSTTDAPYIAARNELTTFAAVTILLILCTIVNACMCLWNFGSGLKPHISNSTFDNDEEKQADMMNMGNGMEMMDSRTGLARKPSGARMTID